MSSMDTVAPRAVTQFATTAREAARRLLDQAVRAYRRRICRLMLQDLPDEILRDIGISRSEIPSVARMVVDRQIDDSRRMARFMGSQP
jgi:uncharacterized protein YjiS (DUF1127 family)